MNKYIYIYICIYIPTNPNSNKAPHENSMAKFCRKFLNISADVQPLRHVQSYPQVN